MTHDEAVRRLNELEPGDTEWLHIEADRIIIRYLQHHDANEVADAWEDARERLRFWYA